MRYSIICALMLALACRPGIDNRARSEALDHEDVSITLQDSINVKIPPDSYNMYHVAFLFDNRLLYGVSLMDPMNIDVIDLKEKSFIRKITLDQHLLNTSQVSNIFIQNEDSIFFLSNRSSIIFLIDGNGSLIDKWEGTDMEISAEDDPMLNELGFCFATSSYLESPYFDPSTHYMYLKLSPAGSYDPVGDVNVKRHGIYDLQNREWVSIFGPYEGVLKDKKDGRYYFDMQEPYQLKVGNFVFVTYPIDNSIYAYDLNNNLQFKIFDGSFNGAEEFPDPLYGNESLDYELLIKMRRSTPFYGPLYYHEDLNIYSRYYNHASGNQKRSLIIYDDQFNVIYTKEYDANWLNKIIPLANGYLVISYTDKDQLDADYLHLKYLKIE